MPKITRPFLLFSLTVTGCLGLNIVSIRKQGSKYYPRAYGKRKLNAVIKSILIDFQEKEKYDEVVKYVNRLSQDIYFEKVFFL